MKKKLFNFIMAVFLISNLSLSVHAESRGVSVTLDARGVVSEDMCGIVASYPHSELYTNESITKSSVVVHPKIKTTFDNGTYEIKTSDTTITDFEIDKVSVSKGLNTYTVTEKVSGSNFMATFTVNGKEKVVVPIRPTPKPDKPKDEPKPSSDNGSENIPWHHTYTYPNSNPNQGEVGTNVKPTQVPVPNSGSLTPNSKNKDVKGTSLPVTPNKTVITSEDEKLIDQDEENSCTENEIETPSVVSPTDEKIEEITYTGDDTPLDASDNKPSIAGKVIKGILISLIPIAIGFIIIIVKRRKREE